MHHLIKNHFIGNLKKENYDDSVCSYLEHTGTDNKVYNVKHYSLELILEVGYKIDVNKRSFYICI